MHPGFKRRWAIFVTCTKNERDFNHFCSRMMGCCEMTTQPHAHTKEGSINSKISSILSREVCDEK